MSQPTVPLNVLIVEDSEDAAILLEEELRSGGYDPVVERVETDETMRAALERSPWDVVLIDYRLPRFSGMGALEVLGERALDIPAIIVSGTVGEERAVELMHAGARDLILKDNLARLVPAVHREVREAGLRREQRRAHEELALTRQRMLDAEVEKKRFYREIVRAVTRGKFLLVDAGEIPPADDCALDAPLDNPAHCSLLRRRIQEIAGAAGMPAERANDLVLAAGEAITNAIKHAVDGRCAVCSEPDRVIARVSDHGDGIRTEDLPAMISGAGFSTQASLGMGYTIMLEMADRVWLATGPEGTVVQLEKLLHPALEEPVVLPATSERL